MGIKRAQWDRKMSQAGLNRAEVPHHVQVWECPPWYITFTMMYYIRQE